jgi:hypothetical protein
VFPGTIESALGLEYDFIDIWGVDQLTFEGFTIGTLLAITALALVGYFWEKRRGPSAVEPELEEASV